MVSLLVNNKGSFMSKLLSSDCFDSFLLEEATIQMAVTFRIDGRLNRDFFDSDEWKDSERRPYELSPWSHVRGYCHDCIKGRKAPAGFRFILQLKPEYVSASLSDVPENTKAAVSSLAINIRMSTPLSDEDALPQNNVGDIHIVTGISMKTFTLDKSAEPAWDRTIERFLTSKGIEFERET